MTEGNSEILDLRGLMCPEPVLRTKKAIEKNEALRIEALVDGEVNVQNLKRLCSSMKLEMTSNQEGDFYRVVIDRDKRAAEAARSSHTHSQATEPFLESKKSANQTGTVVFITRDTFGEGDPQFSRNLLDVFLQTVLNAGHRPRAIIMANSGVKLLSPGSPALKVLDDFREQGVEVLACGLCVEFYGLKEHVNVEQITNMFAISEYLFAADRIISP